MHKFKNKAPRSSFVRWLNIRFLAVAAAFGTIVGFPVYTFVKAQVNGGVERDGDGYFVDLKAMGHFEFDGRNGTVANVPQKFRDLDGKKVALDGFMYAPNTTSDRIGQCQFVYNVTRCCFAGPPLVQERVFAVVPNGGSMYYPGMYQLVRISGLLHVAVSKDDAGNVSSIYRLEVSGAQPRS